MKKLRTFLFLFLSLAAGAVAAVPALDLADAAVRARQPQFTRPSYAVGVADVESAAGRWAYRYQVTRPWCGELPQWPSVNLKPTVTDWSPYDRLVIDVFNDAIGGDILCAFIAGPEGRIQDGLAPSSLPLEDYGFARWVLPLRRWPAKTDPKNIGRIHFFMTTPNAANVLASGFYLLRPGEPVPPVSEAFLSGKVRPAAARREALRRERRRSSVERFAANCRATGQDGRACWIGKATGMEKIRPRDAFAAAGADRFELRLARGEYESLQVLVMPTEGDLADVAVEVSDLRNGADALSASAFACVPVGYVNVTNPAPYKSGFNVATNLPGGYWREKGPSARGWWPDPILDWQDRADVKGDDVQAFWVRLKCPPEQRAGVYTGTLSVRGRNFRKTFPLSVRVYGFTLPKTSPLPLAITFGPGPSTQFADVEQLKLADSLRKDPLSPVNQWKRQEAAWGSFLADYFITMDSLYHRGNVHWDVLKRLESEDRLGRFNLGYWNYPKDLSEASKAKWLENMRMTIGPTYAKAKELGLLKNAYLYGCDEVSSNFFDNIRWAISELKREFPGVPVSTTAYDRQFGVGSPLGDMDWFTPTTDMYEKDFERIPASRAAGHQVWWYIACGQHAPRANLFVEGQAIEARQLMGAQAVKYRPDGFLYYQLSIWNSRRPISGAGTFTDWEPRSWTRYHGDGSWFCCGPDGRPCATIRIENFRDGLEDYFYAMEYERATGRTCEVPPEVCRSVWQYADDPAALYAWRDRLAEEIEKAQSAAKSEATVVNGKRVVCRDGVCMLVEDDAPEAAHGKDRPSAAVSCRIAQGYMPASEFVAFLQNKTVGRLGDAGLWLTLLAVLLGGLAMNLTPCVLPMVPINLMVIGRSAKRGAAYGLGIALAYGLLGLAASVGGLAFGTIQGSPWFNAAVAVVFAGLALALFDVWIVDLSRLRSGSAFASKRSGDRFSVRERLFPFFMGAMSAVLAGACVAPVLVSVLLLTADWAAKGRRLAVLLPFVMGLGMALPWPFAGAGLGVLPKPGRWMKSVNRVFGVIVLGFAAWYGWLAWQGFVPTDGVPKQSIAVEELESALANAKRPVLVDCWASWCKNCAAMDRVLETPDVQAALKGHTVIRVQAEDIDELLKVPGFEKVRGLPAFAVIDR